MAPVNPTDAQTQVNSYVDMHWKDANPIYSVKIDANMLRDYLNSTTPNKDGKMGSEVYELKFMFAHDLTYAQSRAAGTLDPDEAEALSFVLLGYDVTGTYVLTADNMVFNQLKPCPTECPAAGQAACTYLKLSATDPCSPTGSGHGHGDDTDTDTDI